MINKEVFSIINCGQDIVKIWILTYKFPNITSLTWRLLNEVIVNKGSSPLFPIIPSFMIPDFLQLLLSQVEISSSFIPCLFERRIFSYQRFKAIPNIFDGAFTLLFWKHIPHNYKSILKKELNPSDFALFFVIPPLRQIFRELQKIASTLLDQQELHISECNYCPFLPFKNRFLWVWMWVFCFVSSSEFLVNFAHFSQVISEKNWHIWKEWKTHKKRHSNIPRYDSVISGPQYLILCRFFWMSRNQFSQISELTEIFRVVLRIYFQLQIWSQQMEEQYLLGRHLLQEEFQPNEQYLMVFIK